MKEMQALYIFKVQPISCTSQKVSVWSVQPFWRIFLREKPSFPQTPSVVINNYNEKKTKVLKKKLSAHFWAIHLVIYNLFSHSHSLLSQLKNYHMAYVAKETRVENVKVSYKTFLCSKNFPSQKSKYIAILRPSKTWDFV